MPIQQRATLLVIFLHALRALEMVLHPEQINEALPAQASA